MGLGSFVAQGVSRLLAPGGSSHLDHRSKKTQRGKPDQRSKYTRGGGRDQRLKKALSGSEPDHRSVRIRNSGRYEYNFHRSGATRREITGAGSLTWKLYSYSAETTATRAGRAPSSVRVMPCADLGACRCRDRRRSGSTYRHEWRTAVPTRSPAHRRRSPSRARSAGPA